MKIKSLSLWGDSIGKGIFYDEIRNRYVIFKDNCLSKLAREMPFLVKNHSVMGCTATLGAERVTDDTLIEGGIAAIEFGGNDCDMNWSEIAEMPENEHFPRTKIEDFKQALTDIIAKVREGGMLPVLITPPPLDAELYFKWITRTLDPTKILKYLGDIQFIYRWQERYAAAVRDIARASGTKIVDIRDAFLAKHCVRDFLSIDGIHPNAEGYKLINDVIIAYLDA